MNQVFSDTHNDGYPSKRGLEVCSLASKTLITSDRRSGTNRGHSKAGEAANAASGAGAGAGAAPTQRCCRRSMDCIVSKFETYTVSDFKCKNSA